MINWTSPLTLFQQVDSLQRASLVFSGLYLYEFILSIPYDWDIIKRPYERPRTVAGNILYLLCRYLGCVYCICTVVIVNSSPTTNCQMLLKMTILAGDMGIAFASSLLFVRAGVVWKWNRFITGGLLFLLTTVFASGIGAVLAITSTYDKSVRQCTTITSLEDRIFLVAVALPDFITISFVLVGLQRSWHEARPFPLWNALWNQGLLYLLIAILVRVPFVAFLLLNLNPIMNTVFASPSIVMVIIGTTRFHRALGEFAGARRVRAPIVTRTSFWQARDSAEVTTPASIAMSEIRMSAPHRDSSSTGTLQAERIAVPKNFR